MEGNLRMKRISLVAALLGAVVLAFAGVAMAGTTTSTPGNSNGTGTNGKGTAVTHYVATYTDGFFGAVNCTGVNQVKKGTATQDSFTCTSTQGGLTNVTPGQVINWGPNMWLSDFNGTSLDQTFTATVSADGMSYTAVATY
jgi:hypothetical protein